MSFNIGDFVFQESSKRHGIVRGPELLDGRVPVLWDQEKPVLIETVRATSLVSEARDMTDTIKSLMDNGLF